MKPKRIAGILVLLAFAVLLAFFMARCEGNSGATNAADPFAKPEELRRETQETQTNKPDEKNETENTDKPVVREEPGKRTAPAQSGNNNQNNSNSAQAGSNTSNQTQVTQPAQTQPAQTQPTAPTEPATPTLSEAEVIAIYENALRSAGMVRAEETMTAEQLAKYGPTDGMGWYIADVPINDAQGLASRDVASLQMDGYNSYYIESLGSSDGYVHLKVYRGTIE